MVQCSFSESVNGSVLFISDILILGHSRLGCDVLHQNDEIKKLGLDYLYIGHTDSEYVCCFLLDNLKLCGQIVVKNTCKTHDVWERIKVGRGIFTSCKILKLSADSLM